MRETRVDVTAGDGVRIAVQAFDAPSGHAPALLLHHGLASSQRIWDLMLPRLTERFRVVRYDARGHGLSGKPSARYGFEQVTSDALAVMKATRLRKPIVAGHSWGAMVALELAASHPRSVSGLVLVDGGVTSLRDQMSWPEAKRRLTPPRLAGIHVDAFRRMMASFWDGALDVTPEIEEIVLAVMRIGRDGTIRPRLTRSNHMKILRAIWLQDVTALQARLTAPGIAIAARGSGEPGANEWDLAKRRAAARLRAMGSPIEIGWIRGIHDLPLQRPAALCTRIERFAERAVG